MWSNFEYNRRCIRDLEKIRSSLHNYFLYVVPGLTTDLLSYADELDTAYKGIFTHFYRKNTHLLGSESKSVSIFELNIKKTYLILIFFRISVKFPVYNNIIDKNVY